MNRELLRKRVIILLTVDFLLAAFLIWFDEIYNFFVIHREHTFYWREAILESLVIASLGGFTVWQTIRLFRELKYLEGFLPVCSGCKNIRVKDHWVPIEEYIRSHSSAEVTHGLCPSCVEKIYGDLLKESSSLRDQVEAEKRKQHQ